MSQLDFSTTLGNAWFPTPIFTASGCASSGKELAQFFDLRDMGAIVTKSIMTKPVLVGRLREWLKHLAEC